MNPVHEIGVITLKASGGDARSREMGQKAGASKTFSLKAETGEKRSPFGR